jgi:Zn-dependent protease
VDGLLDWIEYTRYRATAYLIFLHSDLIGKDFGIFLTLVLTSVFALIVGIAFHEFSHAAMATALGDQVPTRQGRVTLNPLAHLDPFGTLLMLFVGFGWGKPVQFNPFGLKVRPKTATFLVSAAGPLSNFVAAGLLAIPIKAGWVPYINPLSNIPARLFQLEVTSFSDYAGLFLTGAVYLNVILGVFNLIPLEPLDGFKVALGMMPDDMAREWAKLAQYGPGIILALLFAVPFLTGYNPLADIMGPTVVRLVRLFTGVG